MYGGSWRPDFIKPPVFDAADAVRDETFRARPPRTPSDEILNGSGAGFSVFHVNNVSGVGWCVVFTVSDLLIHSDNPNAEPSCVSEKTPKRFGTATFDGR